MTATYYTELVWRMCIICCNEPIIYIGPLVFGFHGGSVVKNTPSNAKDAEDTGSISGLGRSPEEGNGNPLQYPFLENSMDREAWWAIVHGVTKS